MPNIADPDHRVSNPIISNYFGQLGPFYLNMWLVNKTKVELAIHEESLSLPIQALCPWNAITPKSSPESPMELSASSLQRFFHHVHGKNSIIAISPWCVIFFPWGDWKFPWWNWKVPWKNGGDFCFMDKVLVLRTFRGNFEVYYVQI